jgi:hypothetical protein
LPNFEQPYQRKIEWKCLKLSLNILRECTPGTIAAIAHCALGTIKHVIAIFDNPHDEFSFLLYSALLNGLLLLC